MKLLRLVLITVLFLGLGFAAVSYFAPETLRRLESLSNPAASESPSLSGSSASGRAPTQRTSTKPAVKVADLSSIFKETSNFHQMKDLLAYFDSLPPEEFPNVFQQIQKSVAKNRDQALGLLIGRWVEIDPKGALAETLRPHDGAVKWMLNWGVYGAWAVQDPSAAINQANQLTNRGDRSTALEAIMRALVKKNPQSALTQFNQLSEEQQNMVQVGFVNAWAQSDPQTAANYVKSLPLNDNLILQVAGTWQGVDPQADLAWLDGLPPHQMKIFDQSDALEAWGENDPKAALDYIHALPQDSVLNNGGRSAVIISQWVHSDLQAALAWVNQLPEGKDKDSALSAALSQWAQDDPASAVRYVESMPDGEARQKNISIIATNWAANDPNAAAQWVAGLPDGPQKDEANVKIAQSWANNDPAAAAQWLGKLPLPDGPSKNSAYIAISGAWAQIDPAQAANWLSQLPTGPSRDSAVANFSFQIRDADPERAVQWAESVGDAKQRQNILTSILRGWIWKDPANGAAAVQKSSLPDDVKSQLLQAKH